MNDWRPPPPSVAEVVVIVVHAADRCAHGDASAAAECAATLTAGRLAEMPTVVERGVDMVALEAMTQCWRLGWQPIDLWQFARRRLSSTSVDYLVDLLAADVRRYADATVAPAWRAQLRALGAEVRWGNDRPHLGQWAARNRLSLADAVAIAVELLGLYQYLPAMNELIPPPGSSQVGGAETNGGGRAPSEVDPKVLAKVRALLAKAESTEFAEEAEAFFAKAQELMSRYSLERAMLMEDTTPGVPGGRRIWLDAPYVPAKSLLVHKVAAANRARTVFHEAFGFVTVLGDEVDLEIVEMLTTSLLVHASQSMVAAGRHVDQYGQSRTKSFRQSFLVSYATRIGERLTEAAGAACSTVASELGNGNLLPVLAARSRAVDELFESLFPSLTSRTFSVSNAAGWGAGRVAADLAVLDTHRAVTG